MRPEVINRPRAAAIPAGVRDSISSTKICMALALTGWGRQDD
jgi:hypothetical protein